MNILKDKRLRYGTFSTVMMLFAILLFIMVNLLADVFNRSRDLTAEQIFSLTTQSINFLNTLEQDVTITSLARTGNENVIITQLLEEYAAASNRITVINRDPMLNPAIVHQLAQNAGIDGLPDHSVIVESNGRTRAVLPQDMIVREMGWFGPGPVISFNFESEITRAIHHVTQGEITVVYYVTGSGEFTLPPQFINFLESENFEVREVNLVLHDIPEDAEILFVPLPGRDWTTVKADRVLDFLENEGNAFFALGYNPDPLPNLERVLEAYGIARGMYPVFEGDSRFMLIDSFNVIPLPAVHEITGDADDLGLFNLVILPSAFHVLDVHRATINIQPLWLTSPSAFERVDINEPSQLRVDGDIDGPFALAVAITDNRFVIDRSLVTRIVAVGNLGFLDPGVTNMIGPGNWQFVLNSLRWMQEQPPAIWIPVRVPPGQAALLINDFRASVVSGIAMGGIPLVCIGFGVFVWLKRRHS